MTARFVGVAGLPRCGSTLLCQLLGGHPQIYSEGHSSPLCSTLLRLRHGISDDDFFLSQLDTICPSPSSNASIWSSSSA